MVPKTYEQYTSRRVLTCEWIPGEKLSQSTAGDVGTLVNVGVICYLKQLLDTGFFHVRHPALPPCCWVLLRHCSVLPRPSTLLVLL